MPIETPTLPAVPDYPTDGPHAAALETAHGIFLDELASVEGWEDEGERDGVQLYKKPDPNVRFSVAHWNGRGTRAQRGVAPLTFDLLLQSLAGRIRRSDGQG
jgi:hypothetical protein